MVIKYIRKLLGGRKKAKADETLAAQAAAARRDQRPAIHHRPIPINLIDPDAAKILNRLTRFGHTAYIVGGGVRDLLLERTPKDFDIGTSARPNEVRKLFRNCRIIGRRFRLAHIFFHDKIIEVATFRSNQPEDVAAVEQAVASELPRRGRTREGGARSRRPRRQGPLRPGRGGPPHPLGQRLRDPRDRRPAARLHDQRPLLRYRHRQRHRLRRRHPRPGRARPADDRGPGHPPARGPDPDPAGAAPGGPLEFTIDPGTLAAIRRHKGEIARAAPPRVLEDFLRIFRKGGSERALKMMHEVGVDEIVMPELLAAAQPGDLELERKLLHALDRATDKGTEFSNATILSLVYYPFVRRAIERSDGDGGDGGAFVAIDKVASGFEQRLIVPKRDRDRIRLILLAQKRLMAGGHGGRKVSPGAFVRKPFFPEAFDLFDIVATATGEHREEIRWWKSRISSVAVATDGPSLGPLPPSPSGRRHDRQGPREGERRGGRRRGGRGRGEEGQPRSGGGGAQHRAAPQGQPAREPLEPLIIPELAPGENPYGDAVVVPIPPAAPAAGESGSHAGRHASSAEAGRRAGAAPRRAGGGQPPGAGRGRRRERGILGGVRRGGRSGRAARLPDPRRSRPRPRRDRPSRGGRPGLDGRRGAGGLRRGPGRAQAPSPPRRTRARTQALRRRRRGRSGEPGWRPGQHGRDG